MPPSVLRTWDYTVLPCSDMKAMKNFYREIMGLDIEYERDAWIKFRIHDTALALRLRGDHLFPPTKCAPTPPSGWLFFVEYSEVDVWHDWLSPKGVDILEPPKDREWAQRTLYFHDPEGNVLGIAAEIST